MSLETFREETREWLDANCPTGMRNQTVHFEDAYEFYLSDDAKLWSERMVERGWNARNLSKRSTYSNTDVGGTSRPSIKG